MNRMVPRRAGQSARERFNYLLKMSVALLGGAYVIGLLVVFLVKPNQWLFYALTIPIVGVFYIYRFRRKDFDEIRNAISAWRTGALGEEHVGAILVSLPEGYTVLHDVDTGKGNLDHVVIGPTGVFAIETKAVAGRLWLAQGGRLMNKGFDIEKWISQVQAEAFEVKKCLHRIDLNIWVEALVVLTRIELPKGPIRRKSATIIEADDLLTTILTERGRPLTSTDITRAVAAVYRGDQTVKVGA